MTCLHLHSRRQSTHHDPDDDKQNMEESGEGLHAVLAPPVTLHAPPIHAHVPVGQLVKELDEPWRHRVQAVRYNVNPT